MNNYLNLGLIATALMVTPVAAADLFVSPNGDDANPGTKQKTFATIQKAADTVNPGDTCHILAGTYRETVAIKTSGTADKPILFVAVGEGDVVIDGTSPVTGPWEKHKAGIWKTRWKGQQIEQLLVDGGMKHEARWPDMPFEKRWDHKHWGKVGKETEYGRIEAPGLGKTGVDLTGAIAMLNVGHQFFTWTRTVTSHKKGSNFFAYDKDLEGLAWADPDKGIAATNPKSKKWVESEWRNDYFYLFGKLELLTVPGEWYHDAKAGWLYYMPKGDGPPTGVSVKVRDHGLTADGIDHVQFKGIKLFGCCFEIKNGNAWVLRDCHVTYPSFRRRLVATEQDIHQGPYPSCYLQGSGHVMERCSIRYAGGKALGINGQGNRVENCIITDGAWSGTLHYSLVGINGTGHVIRRNTISRSGAPLMMHKGGQHLIELNHMHDAGILSEDVTAVYTNGEPDGEGARSIIRYNWVHGVQTSHGAGQGIRGDDMTRGLVVHHNVVWDCGMAGIVVKGGENRIYNNTVFDVSNGKPGSKHRYPNGGLVIPTQPEPRKPWKAYHKLNIYLDVQNDNSIIANNLVDDILWRKKKISAPGIKANFEAKDKVRSMMVNPGRFDFRPNRNALNKFPKPLTDKGGKGKDKMGTYIGAYEPGKAPWKPGADWSLK